jgi:molybdate transport repressor ModE-like protein
LCAHFLAQQGGVTKRFVDRLQKMVGSFQHLKNLRRMLEEPYLSAVKKLAELGSFREAAEALGASPASLSRYIGRVEEHIGQKLFERRRGGARLTSAGREFLRLLDHYEEARGAFQAGVQRLRIGAGERLRIGCGPLTSRTLIAPVLTELYAQMPHVRALVEVDATKEPLEKLRRGALDVAICDLTHTFDVSDLSLHVIRKMPVCFWARPDHPIHDRGPLPLAEILRMPLLTPFLHAHWRARFIEILGGDALAREHVAKTPLIESDDYALLTHLARNSDLICGGREEAFEEHDRLGWLRRIRLKDAMQWNICAARRQGNSFEALEFFWDRLVDAFGAPQEGRPQ